MLSPARRGAVATEVAPHAAGRPSVYGDSKNVVSIKRAVTAETSLIFARWTRGRQGCSRLFWLILGFISTALEELHPSRH